MQRTAALILALSCTAAALTVPKGNAALVKSASAIAAPADLDAAPARAVAAKPRGGGMPLFMGMDVGLLGYFFFWYLGNYYYNITNKLALKNSGGASGYPMTIASLQLGIGCIYAIFAWAAPDMRKFPSITADDVVTMLPVAFCAMMAHCASVFAMSAGAVSFGQIVKAAEPAFAAVLSQFVYGKPISKAKWLCLIPVIGGVIIASVKELDFAVSALVAACSANLFAAFKGNENKKLMDTPGLKDRLGTVGNQFAITSLLSFLMSLPMMRAGRAFFSTRRGAAAARGPGYSGTARVTRGEGRRSAAAKVIVLSTGPGASNGCHQQFDAAKTIEKRSSSLLSAE